MFEGGRLHLMTLRSLRLGENMRLVEFEDWGHGVISELSNKALDLGPYR